METALQFYEAAQDVLSLVRVQCYCGNLDKVWMRGYVSFQHFVFFNDNLTEWNM